MSVRPANVLPGGPADGSTPAPDAGGGRALDPAAPVVVDRGTVVSTRVPRSPSRTTTATRSAAATAALAPTPITGLHRRRDPRRAATTGMVHGSTWLLRASATRAICDSTSSMVDSQR